MGAFFFATGDVEATDVRDEILRSSKRCHEAGLDPLGPAVPLKQNRDELAEALERNGAYIEAALPFMRFLGSAVRGTGFILVLRGAAGIVLESFAFAGWAFVELLLKRGQFCRHCYMNRFYRSLLAAAGYHRQTPL